MKNVLLEMKNVCEKCFTRNGGKPGMQEWEGVGGWGVGFILGEVGKFLKSLYIVGR